MGTDGWRTGTDLIDYIRSHYDRFDIFQLIRLLRIYLNTQQNEVHDSVPLDDYFEFKADTGFEFLASEITGLKWPDDLNRKIEILVPSFVLSGRDGPLPESHREMLFRRIQDHDMVLNNFMDIFNNRLNIMRCWLKEISSIGLTSGILSQSRLSRQIRYIAGFNDEIYNYKKFPLNDKMLMAFSGMITGNRRNPVVIANIISTQLSVPVKIKQFTGKWAEIEPEDLTYLGQKGQNNAVGKNAILGKRIWNAHNAISITVGPVQADVLGEIIPGGQRYIFLCLMTGFLVNECCDCEFKISVISSGIPLSKLSSGRNGDYMIKKNGLLLSRNSWIKTKDWNKEDIKTTGFFIKTGDGKAFDTNGKQK
jgi:type VI secretion system protein ImpH